MKRPKTSIWLLQFFGFLFLAMTTIDTVMHRIDMMTSVFLFLGLLSFAVAYCLLTIERRLTALEKLVISAKEEAATAKLI